MATMKAMQLDAPGRPLRLVERPMPERKEGEILIEVGACGILTRTDGAEFLALAAEVPVRTSVTEFPLERANEAMQFLREGKIKGAAVLRS